MTKLATSFPGSYVYYRFHVAAWIGQPKLGTQVETLDSLPHVVSPEIKLLEPFLFLTKHEVLCSQHLFGLSFECGCDQVQDLHPGVTRQLALQLSQLGMFSRIFISHPSCS